MFYQCTLTVDDSYGEDSTVSLGRPWQTECYTESVRTEDGTFVMEYDPDRKNPSYENTASSVTFVECTMDSAIQNERWNVWTRKIQREIRWMLHIMTMSISQSITVKMKAGLIWIRRIIEYCARNNGNDR